jgi:hypothetical protein
MTTRDFNGEREYDLKAQTNPTLTVTQRQTTNDVPYSGFRSHVADVSTRTVDQLGPMGDPFMQRGGPVDAVKPRLSYEQENSAMNFGKNSVSRRLPEMERLRYHIPGYQGFVRRQQFHHGQTYGATTRTCILGYKPNSAPMLGGYNSCQ